MNAILVHLLILILCMTGYPIARDSAEAEIPSVRLGNLLWMTKNLEVSHFQNGDPILQAKNAEEWKRLGHAEEPVWCYCNFDPAYGKVYGKLYNWYAVTDPRGLAPAGWKIPSDENFKEMILYILRDSLLSGINPDDDAGCCLNFDTGGFRAEKAWQYKTGSNSSQFSALPGGGIYEAQFRGYGGYEGFEGAFFWTSSEFTENEAWTFYILLNHLNNATYPKKSGFSVRCVRN